MKKEHFELTGSDTAKDILSKYLDYRFFWRSGFAYRGATESEDNKQTRKEYVWKEKRVRDVTFEERMQHRYDWSAAIDIDVDHEKKEIHMNGFSENDMY